MNLPFSESVLKALAHMDPYAVERFADCGSPRIFTPFIGRNAEETCERIERAASLLHYLLDDEDRAPDDRAGMALIAEAIWLAAQYEGFRAMERKNRLAKAESEVTP